ncbi:MAG: DUF5596 domain-containing protein, partial [Cellulosilyticum sp.]|nr:DUF5596 domain-containing protein [Cellulosilyticum sp.]
MKLIDLCNQLELPKEVVEQVMSCSTRIGEGAPEELLVGLTNKIHAKESYEKLIAYTNPENLGMDMLTYMLYAALKTYDKYIEKNISEKVYIDTMKCFTRFINEHHASFGYYGFDRGWWTHRQLSMVLFRIGELEYEFIDDQKCVSLHIPSGANIALEACQKSFKAYQDFV